MDQFVSAMGETGKVREGGREGGREGRKHKCLLSL